MISICWVVCCEALLSRECKLHYGGPGFTLWPLGWGGTCWTNDPPCPPAHCALCLSDPVTGKTVALVQRNPWIKADGWCSCPALKRLEMRTVGPAKREGLCACFTYHPQVWAPGGIRAEPRQRQTAKETVIFYLLPSFALQRGEHLSFLLFLWCISW